MLFNSISFLIFFPVVVLIYFLFPRRTQWVWLLAASYYFYMAWNPRYAALLAVSTATTYLSGILIARAERIGEEGKRRRVKKLWVVLSLAVNLGLLFFFKYFDFALRSLGQVLAPAGIRFTAPKLDIVLPVGISFYTFQALGYTLDVYRGEVPVERNPARYALFVSFFPQLVAGPIERSKNLLAQIHEEHSFDYERVKTGLLWMGWGFFKKLLVADRAAVLVNEVYENYGEYAWWALALATVLFAFQIYCDFSGYSDIAKGAALVMGFRLMDNFRQPYLSTSVREFWRRWHISLSQWFRDYVYIPLGGSRLGPGRKRLNLMATFLLSGLWHGASWSFVIWGGLHGLYQIAEDLLSTPKKKGKKKGKREEKQPFSHRFGRGLVTFALVDFAWIFFRAESARSALRFIRRVFSGAGSAPGVHLLERAGYSLYDAGLLAAAVLILTLVDTLRCRFDVLEELAEQELWFRWAVYLALLFTLLFAAVCYAEGGGQEFIYFQF